ncbi:MAG: sporulation protein YunB [Candidatus Merdivicinus sp.]|jgi:sporulation protein YunB
MRRRTKGSIGRLFRILFAIGIIVLAWNIWRIRAVPIARSIAEHQAIRAAQEAILSGVTEALEEIDSDQMISLTYGQDGHISAAQADFVSVNQFQALLSEKIGYKLRELSEISIGIPVGNLLGGVFLAGRGPVLHCKLLSSGSYSLRLTGKFEDAGVNQTRWQLMLSVESQVSALFAGERVQVSVPGEYLVAETVFVGTVPENYTYVVTDGSSLLSDLNDYRE